MKRTKIEEVMKKDRTIICWDIDPFISFFGVIGLATILIILPVQAGANLLNAKYWISLLECVGFFGFIFYLGLWGILIYYVLSINSLAMAVIAEERIYLCTLVSIAYAFSWSELSELEIIEAGPLAADMIITTVQGKNIKFRFVKGEKDPTAKIQEMRDLSMLNK